MAGERATAAAHAHHTLSPSPPLPCCASQDQLPPNVKCSIISYDLATKVAKGLEEIGFGVCVCDESHILKNPTALRTKALLPLATKAKRTLFLSGTPVLSRPIEIYTQAAALRPNIFGSLQKHQREFSIRYAAGHQGKWGWDEKGATNTEALCAVLTHCLMIRREKSAVLTQLPSKLRSKLPVDVPSKERVAIANKLMKVQQQGGSQDGGESMQHNPLVGELYQETGLAKVQSVGLHIDYLLSPNDQGGGGVEKLLLFGHHKKVLDALASHLMAKKCKYVRIDGNVDVKDRQTECDRFQTDRSIQVALLSINAAGVGLTLTAASYVVFAECSWEIGKLRQAEDRAHRIGQKKSVVVQYCLAEGTLDDWMWRTVERKLEVTASTMDGGHGSPMVREFVPGGGGGGGNGEPKEVKGGGGGSGEKENRRESGGSDIRYWLAPPPAQAVGSRGAGTSSDLEAARELWRSSEDAGGEAPRPPPPRLHAALAHGQPQFWQQPPPKESGVGGKRPREAGFGAVEEVIDLLEEQPVYVVVDE